MKKETVQKTENKEIIENIAKQAAEKIEQEIEKMEREKTVEAIAEGFKKDHKEVFITDIAGLQLV